MIRKISIALILLISLCNISFAQDIHFSQFDSSPLNLNPALTGSFDGDLRFIANLKNQWQSITVPYRTISSSIDKTISLQKQKFGIGLLVNADKAGDSEYGTTQVKLSFSYGKYLNKDSSFYASTGANISLNQNSINYNNLYFGSQFVNGRYNSNLPNNETFNKSSIYYVDFSAGINFIYKINNKTPLHFGVGFTHLNSPQQSFNKEQLSKLDRKYNFHLTSNIEINERYSFLPQIVYYKQGKFQELDYGGLIKGKVNNISFHNFYLGGWIRNKDAAIANISFDYQNMYIGISYDINTSQLRRASNGFGGIEFSLIYILRKTPKINIPYIKICPTLL